MYAYTICSFETIGCDAKMLLLCQEAQKRTSDCVSQHLLLVAQRNIQLLKDYRHFCTSLLSESYVNVANDELVKSQREVLASTKHTIKSLKERSTKENNSPQDRITKRGDMYRGNQKEKHSNKEH